MQRPEAAPLKLKLAVLVSEARACVALAGSARHSTAATVSKTAILARGQCLSSRVATLSSSRLRVVPPEVHSVSRAAPDRTLEFHFLRVPNTSYVKPTDCPSRVSLLPRDEVHARTRGAARASPSEASSGLVTTAPPDLPATTSVRAEKDFVNADVRATCKPSRPSPSRMASLASWLLRRAARRRCRP